MGRNLKITESENEGVVTVVPEGSTGVELSSFAQEVFEYSQSVENIMVIAIYNDHSTIKFNSENIKEKKDVVKLIAKSLADKEITVPKDLNEIEQEFMELDLSNDLKLVDWFGKVEAGEKVNHKEFIINKLLESGRLLNMYMEITINQ